MNPAASAPQILADPAWIHITPSQTRMAVHASAASFEVLSDSHTGRLVRLAGSPMTVVTVLIAVFTAGIEITSPRVPGPVSRGPGEPVSLGLTSSLRAKAYLRPGRRSPVRSLAGRDQCPCQTGSPGAGNPREEAAHRSRVAQHVHLGARQVRGDGDPQVRQVPPPVGNDPPPVLGLLVPPPQAPPYAPRQAEVQHDDRVRRRQPGPEPGVVRPEVPVEDPAVPREQFPLPGNPFHGRRRGRPRLPEHGVKRGRGDPGPRAEFALQDGFARPAPPKYHDSPHAPHRSRRRPTIWTG